jgi:hypothetical protein
VLVPGGLFVFSLEPPPVVLFVLSLEQPVLQGMVPSLRCCGGGYDGC